MIWNKSTYFATLVHMNNEILSITAIDYLEHPLKESFFDKFTFFQCTFQLESNTSALEILGSDLTNKDEAFFINKATKDITKNNKSIKDMVMG